MKNSSIYYCILLLACTLFGCGKAKSIPNDKRAETPFNFRIEMAYENADDGYLFFDDPVYTYPDKNGHLQKSALSGSKRVPAPFSQSYVIPGNFYHLKFEASYSPHKAEDVLSVKLYVNDKLLVSESCFAYWMCDIAYDLKEKKYIVDVANKRSVEGKRGVFDKLD